MYFYQIFFVNFINKKKEKGGGEEEERNKNLCNSGLCWNSTGPSTRFICHVLITEYIWFSCCWWCDGDGD